MSIKYGFFNSVDGDRVYNADDMSNYFKGLISDGVYANLGDSLRVSPTGEGMTIRVGTGRAIINSKYIDNDAALNIELSPADVQYSRTDSIIINLDEEKREISIIAIDKSKLTSTMQYLTLAEIEIPPATTTITLDMIKDMRGTQKCLYVTGLVNQLNTDGLFDQWTAIFQKLYDRKQAEYENWFETLTQDLMVKTYIKKQLYTYNITEEMKSTNNYKINIDGFDPLYDFLLVVMDGIVLTEGTDYTISEDNTYISTIKGSWNAGNRLTFTVLKSKIGGSVSGKEISSKN